MVEISPNAVKANGNINKVIVLTKWGTPNICIFAIVIIIIIIIASHSHSHSHSQISPLISTTIFLFLN
ncbi:hypothetical protein QVD17_36726 [Tagetes erecta]|uniref:Uncharacterized protein n=1 Tax=Tagetes erecta TaxID=13708 RepID=A0AAD8NJ84_TARER|nr:hypothetical protein QVD17_36726 [Tagetes erecta]